MPRLTGKVTVKATSIPAFLLSLWRPYVVLMGMKLLISNHGDICGINEHSDPSRRCD